VRKTDKFYSNELLYRCAKLYSKKPLQHYVSSNGYACDYKVTSLVKLKHTHASMQQTSKFKHMEKTDEQITILSSKMKTRNTAGATMIVLCSTTCT
jgi:aspartate/glutamate racemase